MKDFTLDELRESTPCQIGENPIQFLLPSWYDSRGEKGGYIFPTSEEALKHKERLVKGAEWKIEQTRQEEARKQKEAEEERALIASYGGFLNKSALKAGKQRATLEKTVWFPPVYRIVSKKEFVEILVNDGYKPDTRAKMIREVGNRGYLVKDGDKQEFILTKENSTYVVNKTEWEYADFLYDAKILLG
jgi:hypothetical protein